MSDASPNMQHRDLNNGVTSGIRSAVVSPWWLQHCTRCTQHGGRCCMQLADVKPWHFTQQLARDLNDCSTSAIGIVVLSPRWPKRQHWRPQWNGARKHCTTCTQQGGHYNMQLPPVNKHTQPRMFHSTSNKNGLPNTIWGKSKTKEIRRWDSQSKHSLQSCVPSIKTLGPYSCRIYSPGSTKNKKCSPPPILILTPAAHW